MTAEVVVDLNTLIPPGASLDLTYAVAINDKGEIAGFGVPPGCAAQDHPDCEWSGVVLSNEGIAVAVEGRFPQLGHDCSQR
jgi:hypothetical protein